MRLKTMVKPVSRGYHKRYAVLLILMIFLCEELLNVKQPSFVGTVRSWLNVGLMHSITASNSGYGVE